MTHTQYDVPLPPPLPLPRASRSRCTWQRSHAHRARLQGEVKICRNAAHIRHCHRHGALAAILHIEGAEGIDPDLHMLDVLYEAGLRSIGPVWSRSNIFGHGVPFRYPVDARHRARA